MTLELPKGPNMPNMPNMPVFGGLLWFVACSNARMK